MKKTAPKRQSSDIPLNGLIFLSTQTAAKEPSQSSMIKRGRLRVFNQKHPKVVMGKEGKGKTKKTVGKRETRNLKMTNWTAERGGGLCGPKGLLLWAGPVLLPLPLRMLTVALGIYWVGLTSWYQPEVLWVTGTGRRSWITTKQWRGIHLHPGSRKLHNTVPVLRTYLRTSKVCAHCIRQPSFSGT